jgi:hypothetical protein
MTDGNGTILEYADGGPRVRATMEATADGVRLRLPPSPVTHRWLLAVVVTGAIWTLIGVVWVLDWAVHHPTASDLREILSILCSSFVIAASAHGLLETVCPRWTEMHVGDGRLVLRCHGFPRRRRRREWPLSQVAKVEYRRRWGIRLLGSNGRSLYMISEGLAADQEWLAVQLTELARLARVDSQR